MHTADFRDVSVAQVKDEFTDGAPRGFRYININVEVGWTIESESGQELSFVSVQDFGKKYVRTHICEVQVLLKSTYELKVGGCHDNFVKARDLLTV